MPLRNQFVNERDARLDVLADQAPGPRDTTLRRRDAQFILDAQNRFVSGFGAEDLAKSGRDDDPSVRVDSHASFRLHRTPS
jgi:hypothetical protein